MNVNYQVERDSEARFMMMRDVIIDSDLMSNPFEVWDLGAHKGYFGKRFAEEFGAFTYAFDKDDIVENAAWSDPITGQQMVKPIVQDMCAKDLALLRRADVSLALSVLHHCIDWKDVLRQVLLCRQFAFIEVAHPDEVEWIHKARARAHIVEQYETVMGLDDVSVLGETERVGKNGKTYLRPLVCVPGMVSTFYGKPFDGSKSCSRNMPVHMPKILRALGESKIYPGSLNLKIDREFDSSNPWRNSAGRRPYWFWQAWMGDHPCYAMVPATRGHGPDYVEVVSPISIRKTFNVTNDTIVCLDVDLHWEDGV